MNIVSTVLGFFRRHIPSSTPVSLEDPIGALDAEVDPGLAHLNPTTNSTLAALTLVAPTLAAPMHKAEDATYVASPMRTGQIAAPTSAAPTLSAAAPKDPVSATPAHQDPSEIKFDAGPRLEVVVVVSCPSGGRAPYELQLDAPVLALKTAHGLAFPASSFFPDVGQSLRVVLHGLLAAEGVRLTEVFGLVGVHERTAGHYCLLFWCHSRDDNIDTWAARVQPTPLRTMLQLGSPDTRIFSQPLSHSCTRERLLSMAINTPLTPQSEVFEIVVFVIVRNTQGGILLVQEASDHAYGKW